MTARGGLAHATAAPSGFALGASVSVLLHAGMIAAILLWPDRAPPRPPEDAVGVALVFSESETEAPMVGQQGLAVPLPPEAPPPADAQPDLPLPDQLAELPPIPEPPVAAAPPPPPPDPPAQPVPTAPPAIAENLPVAPALAELPPPPVAPPRETPEPPRQQAATVPPPEPPPLVTPPEPPRPRAQAAPPRPPPPPRQASRSAAAPPAPSGPPVEGPRQPLVLGGGVATGAVVPPSLEPGITNPPPPYPDQSRRAGEQGVVGIVIAVAPDGSVSDVRVAQSSGHPALDEAAREAARQWRFRPGTRDGVPAASTIRTAVHFRLQSAAR